MDDFEYEALPGRVIFGAGASRERLAAEVGGLGYERLLVVCSPRDDDLADRLTEPFGDRVAARFGQVREHVPMQIAEQARRAARSAAADALLVIGGGSAVGTGKAVALTDRLPVIAVPTTYAGSEMTPVWGITEDDRKVTGVDRAVLAAVVVYDPELTVSLPVELSVASGLNAMAHAVEALWAPGRNPISTIVAQEAMTALVDGLPRVARAPGDVPGRARTLYGAYLAGAAFAVAGAGLHHKACHVLGGSYGLPHARTHAVLLPYVLAVNATFAPAAAARVAAALDVPDGQAAAALQAWGRLLGAPGGLRELGMAEHRIAEAAARIAAVAPADNPWPVDPGHLEVLLRAAWAGADPDPGRVGDGRVGAGR